MPSRILNRVKLCFGFFPHAAPFRREDREPSPCLRYKSIVKNQ